MSPLFPIKQLYYHKRAIFESMILCLRQIRRPEVFLMRGDLSQPGYPYSSNRSFRREIPRYIIIKSTSDNGSQVLNRFWQSQGVVDASQRQLLVQVGLAGNPNSSFAHSPRPTNENNSERYLIGASSGFLLDQGDAATADEVVRVSQSLLSLQRLLGQRDDIDIVWMIQREPKLLDIDASTITRRLVTLVTAQGSTGIDVVKLVEAQPGLLLDDTDDSSENSAIENGDEFEETLQQRHLAWEFGLLTDNDTQWSKRLSELQLYKSVHGDAHIGYRDGDDPSLVRWATKQRKEQSLGILTQHRHEKLVEIGFEFDAEQAEWLRWYNQLRRFKESEGHCNPMPLTAGSDFLLLNWCSIQRIARRSQVLQSGRQFMLDDLGFDWTGADALS